jgi:tetratricopeptide (TPR) repeat protein
MRNTLAVTGLVLLALLVLFTACSSKKEIAQGYYETASRFSEQDNPDSALVYYRKALKIYPRYLEAHFRYQDLLRYTLSREDEAFGEYRKLRNAHPDDALYRYLYARLETDPDRMLEDAEAIIRRDSRFYWGHFHLGLAYYRLDYDDDAIAAFQKAATLDPDEENAYYYQGIIHQNKGEYERANELYRRVMSMDSTRTYLLSSIWRNRYNMAEDQEKAKQEILAEIDAVMEERSDDLSLFSSIRYTLQFLNESDRAVEVEKRILEKDTTGYYPQMFAYTRIYQKPTNRERVEAARAFLKEYPEGLYRKYVYSLLFRYMKALPDTRSRDLEEVAKRWMDEYPDDVNTYYTLSRSFYLENGEYDKAIDFARRGLAKANRRMKGYLMDTMGWAYHLKGESGEAIPVLEAADTLGGAGSADIRYHLSAAYLAEGETDKALELSVKSLSVRENEQAREQFYRAYEEKFRSRVGANDYLNNQILSYTAVEEPYEAPGFTLASLTGGEVSFSDHIGKLILVNFWKPG